MLFKLIWLLNCDDVPRMPEQKEYHFIDVVCSFICKLLDKISGYKGNRKLIDGSSYYFKLDVEVQEKLEKSRKRNEWVVLLT